MRGLHGPRPETRDPKNKPRRAIPETRLQRALHVRGERSVGGESQCAACVVHPKLETRDPTPHPKPETRKAIPETRLQRALHVRGQRGVGGESQCAACMVRDPKPETRKTEPESQYPKPGYYGRYTPEASVAWGVKVIARRAWYTRSSKPAIPNPKPEPRKAIPETRLQRALHVRGQRGVGGESHCTACVVRDPKLETRRLKPET